MLPRALRLFSLLVAACGVTPPELTLPPAVANEPPPVHSDPPPVATTNGRAPMGITDISVSSGELIPAFQPNIFQYELSALQNLEPIAITVSGQDATVDGIKTSAGVPLPMTVPALDEASPIVVEAFVDGKPVTYTIASVPAARPKYTVTSAAPEPGLIYSTPGNFLYILGNTGILRFWVHTPRPPYNFRKHTLPDGTTRYSYIMTDSNISVFSATVYVLDEHFKQLETIKLLATTAHAAGPVDVHEFLLLDHDHYIVESYLPKTEDVPGYGMVKVTASVLQEVKSGVVVLDWDSTSYPQLYADSTAPGYNKVVATDYAHLNGIAIDPKNDNLVVSLLMTDSLIEIDRKTGAILWSLGGKSDSFGLASVDKPFHQHNPSFLDNDHILLFDNGQDEVTKIREYTLDRVNMTATATALSIDSHHTAAMGSVQKLGSSYFIGWGARPIGQSDMTELDVGTKAKSFELTFAAGATSYRAFKFQ